jgi:hypothetical protein
MIAGAAAEVRRGLVLLTETFSTGFGSTSRHRRAEGGPSSQFLVEPGRRARRVGRRARARRSRRRRVDDDQRPSNVFVLAGPDGTVHRYRKIHPFSHAGEHEHVRAGTDFVTVDVEGFRVSLFVCYDLRFADEFWQLAPTPTSTSCRPTGPRSAGPLDGAAPGAGDREPGVRGGREPGGSGAGSTTRATAGSSTRSASCSPPPAAPSRSCSPTSPPSTSPTRATTSASCRTAADPPAEPGLVRPPGGVVPRVGVERPRRLHASTRGCRSRLLLAHLHEPEPLVECQRGVVARPQVDLEQNQRWRPVGRQPRRARTAPAEAASLRVRVDATRSRYTKSS